MTTAQVDFRTFGALEKLVEDGTGEASRKIMKIFHDYVRSYLSDSLTVSKSADEFKYVLLKKPLSGALMRNFQFFGHARINVEDAKKHGSFHIIVSDQHLAEIVLEHQDFIEKKLFGNNKVKIVDYETKTTEAINVWHEFTAICDTHKASGVKNPPLSPKGFSSEKLYEMANRVIQCRMSEYEGGTEGNVVPLIVKDQMSEEEFAEFSAKYQK